jgi:F-type H+-transporting ATPase subunit a
VAGSTYNTPSDYIGHHLAFNEVSFGEHPFWTMHVDSVVMAVLLGLISMGLIWLVARKATAGIPTKRQAFIELLFGFIDDQVKTSFSGNRHAFIAPAALTVFVWVLMMNAMDFLPIDIMATIYNVVFKVEYWRNVPTSDVNTTFALAIGVWFLMIFFGIKVHGLKGWLHDLFCAPFGSNPFVWPANFLFNMIEYVSKPLSHSLRLFGNMYAGEVIFLLIGMLAASGIFGVFFSALLGAGWAIFHILIVALQAFVFMMLTVVYLSMAHDGH